jgi:hypothetical protein
MRATQAFFQIEPLSPTQWVVALLVGLAPATVLELEKLVRGRVGNFPLTRKSPRS